MQKPKNIVALSGPSLVSMSRKVLSRMMKAKSPNPMDQRRLILFLERLSAELDSARDIQCIK
jgi:hypothetical protein